MGCSCKNYADLIEAERGSVETLREFFIKRMTVDSESQDRRKKDYNQAIFHYRDDGTTYQCFCDTDMEMVLECFDNAAKDLRRTWCDVECCKRK